MTGSSLAGRRVVVTRASEQASGLSDRLLAAGAQVIELPLARFFPPVDGTAFDAALDRLDTFTWVAFTSVNAVHFTWERWRKRDPQTARFTGPAIAAVGAATAAALKDVGLHVDLVPPQAHAEALAEALIARSAHVIRPSILLPQANNARPALGERLMTAGWSVTPVIAYQAVPVAVDAQLLEAGADAVAFASAATVERFIAGLGRERVDRLIAAGCRFYAIGPQTAAAVQAAGLTSAAVAGDATLDALVAAIIADWKPVE